MWGRELARARYTNSEEKWTLHCPMLFNGTKFRVKVPVVFSGRGASVQRIGQEYFFQETNLLIVINNQSINNQSTINNQQSINQSINNQSINNP
jgi:hypothetical protein